MPSRLEKASWIAGIIGTVIGVAGLVYELHKPKEDQKPIPPVTQISRDGGTQIGNVFGNVVINRPADNAPPTQNLSISDHFIFRGVSASFAAYSTDGMVGMQTVVDKCYKTVNPKTDLNVIKQCLASDITGLYWDRGMDQLMDFPPDQYFSEEKILARVSAAFATVKVDKSIWENYVFKGWLPQIQEQYKDIAAKEAFDQVSH